VTDLIGFSMGGKRKNGCELENPNAGLIEMLSARLCELKNNGNVSSRSNLNTNTIFAWTRALKAIQLHTQPITSGAQAKRDIKFVGDHIATQIDMYFADSTKQSHTQSQLNSTLNNKDHSTNHTHLFPGSSMKSYQPRYRSAPFGLLLGLLDLEQEMREQREKLVDGTSENVEERDGRVDGFVFRKEVVVEKSQKYCDEMIVKANKTNSRDWYDGWSSMNSTLMKKGLVVCMGHPKVYALTSDGRSLAMQLRQQLGAKNGTTVTRNERGENGVGNDVNDDEKIKMTDVEVMDRLIQDSCGEVSIYDAAHSVAEVRSNVRHSHAHYSCDEIYKRASLLIAMNKANTSRNRKDHSVRKHNEKDPIVVVDDDVRGSERCCHNQLVMLIDKRETRGGGKARVEFEKALDASCDGVGDSFGHVNDGLKMESRVLHVGDCVFIVRKCAAATQGSCCEEFRDELLIDLVIERKTVEDFIDSMMSGRLLKQLNMMKVMRSRGILILEGSLDHKSWESSSNALFNSRKLPLSVLQKKLAHITTQFGFSVIHTRDSRHSASVYRSLYHGIHSQLKAKRNRECIGNDMKSFEQFESEAKSHLEPSIQHIFHAQLCCLRGISQKTSQRILDHFPTPLLFINAFMNSTIAPREVLRHTLGITNSKVIQLIESFFVIKQS